MTCLKRNFQAFNEADSPVPFIFAFSGGPVERDLIINEKTNEELAMGSADLEAGMMVAIKRSVMEKTD